MSAHACRPPWEWRDGWADCGPVVLPAWLGDQMAVWWHMINDSRHPQPLTVETPTYASHLASHSQASTVSTAEVLATHTVCIMLGRADSIVVALAQMRCPKVWVSTSVSICSTFNILGLMHLLDIYIFFIGYLAPIDLFSCSPRSGVHSHRWIPRWSHLGISFAKNSISDISFGVRLQRFYWCFGVPTPACTMNLWSSLLDMGLWERNGG